MNGLGEQFSVLISTKIEISNGKNHILLSHKKKYGHLNFLPLKIRQVKLVLFELE